MVQSREKGEKKEEEKKESFPLECFAAFLYFTTDTREREREREMPST